MPATPEDLLARLDALGIRAETHRHPPLFTVAESKALRGALPGGHCKSLFLKNRQGRLWLVVALEDTAIDLKWLTKRLGARRLSFASPELLHEILGVAPGAVTPFGLINDRAQRAHVVLDKTMLAEPLLNYHPLTNDATTAIASEDLLRFIAACGHRPEVVDFGAA